MKKKTISICLDLETYEQGKKAAAEMEPKISLSYLFSLALMEKVERMKKAESKKENK